MPKTTLVPVERSRMTRILDWLGRLDRRQLVAFLVAWSFTVAVTATALTVVLTQMAGKETRIQVDLNR